MKKILFFSIAIFCVSNVFAQLRGQQQENKNPLLNQSFWKGKPDLATVKTAFEKEKFNFKDVTAGEDPLNLAINNEAGIDIIKYLEDQPGVDLQRGIHEGRTYLHSAASKGYAEAIDCLLKKGADMYYKDAHDQTALTYSAFVNSISLATIEAFVNNGLDVNRKYTSKNDANILLLAAGADKDMRITDYLVSKGVSLHSTDKSGNTAFNYAAKQGNVDVLKGFLSKGVKYNDNALFMAAEGPFRSTNKIDVFKYLVDEVKINPLVTNKAGQNVLHLIATKQGQDDIITYFINKGVDINKVDSGGNTPFMGIAGSKNIEMISALLPKVKNINAVNNKGDVALSNAVKSSNAEIVALLIKSGANVKTKNKEGKTLAYSLIDAYRGAGGRGGFGGGNNAGTQVNPADEFAAKLNVLKANGLDVTAPQKDGSTLYHIAAAKNDLALLKSLSGLGIDINAKNGEGMTALQKVALLAKTDEILKYLISIGADKTIKTEMGETAYDLAKGNGFLTKDNVSVDFLK